MSVPVVAPRPRDGPATADGSTACNGTHPALLHLDPSTRFLYAPHTISVMAIGVVTIMYAANVLNPPPSSNVPAAAAATSQLNTQYGIWAAIFVFLGYSVVQGPSTSMVRPHPAVWRLVHGVLMVYLLFLTWLVFQSVDDARQFLRYLHPDLGVPVPYRSYGADCVLYRRGEGVNWGVIRSTLFDEFVVAHVIGWWAKALVVRNHLLLWAESVAFELMEASFSHHLPNFNECWWDSWLLDVAVCNFFGIMAGMWTVRWFECKYERYNWQGLSTLPSLSAKARRSVQQLLPYSWSRFKWGVFSCPARLLQGMLVVVLMLAFELNVFFLKYALWVPPRNPINTYRLLLWFLCALPGVREYYEYIEGQATAHGPVKLGMFGWLSIALACLETMISVKFGAGLYTTPTPARVKWFWGAMAAVSLPALAAWQLSLWHRQQKADAAAGEGHADKEE